MGIFFKDVTKFVNRNLCQKVLLNPQLDSLPNFIIRMPRTKSQHVICGLNGIFRKDAIKFVYWNLSQNVLLVIRFSPKVVSQIPHFHV